MAPTTALEKAKTSEEKNQKAQVPEVLTTIDQIKSKWSCPACNKKRLIALYTDNWTEPKRFVINPNPGLKRKPKEDLITTHHCLSCNFGLTENEDRKQMRERNDKDKSSSDQPWAAGAIFLILMLGTILMLTVYQEEQRGPSFVETVEQSA